MKTYLKGQMVHFHFRGSGHTTKFWLLPDALLHDTEGEFHFRWAQHHAGYLNDTYGIAVSPYQNSHEENTVRKHLIRQSMVRLNHSAKSNGLCIEGVASAFTPKVVCALIALIRNHPDEMMFVQINRFDSTCHRYESKSADLSRVHPPAQIEQHIDALSRYLGSYVPA